MSEANQAYEGLVRAHHSEVYAAARRILRNDADALDVTQQVYLRVLEQGDGMGGAEDPRRVLCWLASKLALVHIRGEKNRRRREESQVVESPEQSDKRVEKNEELGTVRELLGALPDELRLPLVLRFQSGMSFAAVAESLDCSESTAHLRIQKGMARLGQRLRELGFAGLAIDLGDHLRVPMPVAVPRGLEGQLLGLVQPASVFGVASLLKAAFLVPLLCGITAIGVLVWQQVEVDSESSVRTTQVGAKHGSEAVAITPEDVASHDVARAAVNPETQTDPKPAAKTAGPPRAVLRGRVVNKAGLALKGASITARSAEMVGKSYRYSETSLSDEAGAYELEVPVSTPTGQAYYLHVQLRDHHMPETIRVQAQAGKESVVADSVLERWAEDREGSYELTLFVEGPAGQVVANAQVVIYRLFKVGTSTGRRPEVGGKTDENGGLILRGNHVGGRKQIVISAPGKPWKQLRVPLVIVSEGGHRQNYALERGLTIEGQLRALDGWINPKEFSLSASRIDRPMLQLRAQIAADGHFVFGGLEAGEYSISSVTRGWSAFTVAGVEAGRHDLELVVKRPMDLRSGGLHGPEVHGTVVDAKTGLPLVVTDFDVNLERLSDKQIDLSRDVLPPLLHPIVRQGMGGGQPPSSEFHVSALKPGRYVVVVRLRGYALGTSEILTLDADSLLSGVRVELNPGTVIEGVVLDDLGRPVKDTYLMLIGSDEGLPDRVKRQHESIVDTAGRRSGLLGGKRRSDGAGRYRFEHVPLGVSVRVVAMHQNWDTAASDVVTSTAVRDHAKASVKFVRRR